MTRPAQLNPKETTMKIKVLKVGSIKKTFSGCAFLVDDPLLIKKS